MSSTFFGLSIAGSALRAANAAMNTASNNIANADTDGYSKQVVVQQAASALRTFTTYGCAGAGVDTISIERLRDSFYDTKYRNNETNYGEYSTKSSYMETIEDYFTDDGKTGFSSVFSSMKSALEEVAKNAGDTSTKSSFVSSLSSLSEYFNTMSTDLKNEQSSVNGEVKQSVDQINSISQEIANIDKQINVIEMTGTTANDLRDKRDSLVDDLSKIVDVSVSETQVVDSTNPNSTTGATRYLVKIAGGQTLVDGNDSEQLSCVARSTTQKVNQSDADGLYDIYWSNGQKLNVSNDSMGGTLEGLLELRDGNNGETFSGTVSSVDVTNNTATVAVTADNLTDLNKNNLSDTGQVTIGNKIYSYTGWTYNKTVDATGNATYSYTFQLGSGTDNAITADKVGTTTSVGTSTSYEGIHYYMEQMNEWVRNFSEAFNKITQSGYTSSGSAGSLVLTANYTSGSQGTFTDGTSCFGTTTTAGTYSVSTSDNSYYRLTAANFAVSKSIVNNAALLATKTSASSTFASSKTLPLVPFPQMTMASNSEDAILHKVSSFSISVTS